MPRSREDRCLRARPVMNAVRSFNKRVLNPAMMILAGRRHWYASVLRHKGRRSGKEYATPVVAEPVAGDAFIIPLPYGEGVDWLENVLAAGGAVIESKGETYDVFEPEVLGAEEAFPLLEERHRRTWRRFGIERYFRLKKAYRDPGAPRWEELRRFRDAHPPKHTTVGGVRWDYIAAGDGDEALLILPGGAMVGEAGFTRIPAYEENYRVIAPSYGSVSTAAELLDGLAGVLDAEGVREAHMIGQSYGGLVAQCFVRRHPDRARSLILTNTLAPPRRMLRLSQVLLRLLPLVPAGWLRKLRERGLARAFHGVPGVPPEDQAFWSEYQHGLISRQSKAELLDLYRLGIDLVQSFRIKPGDLASWPGRVFILESDEDILTPEQRAELRRCYPRADVYTIHGAGHTPWMSHKEEYLSAVRGFLAGRVPEPPSGASLEQRLQAFRRMHPYKEIGVGSLRWRYVVGGRGERTILLPSGGTRVPDMYLLLFEALEPHFRVISPAYQPAHTMDGLVDGLAAVLDAEGTEKVDLFGSSFGGFVAQCFVRRYPERVRSLILANTSAPGTSPLPGLPLLVRLFGLFPEDVVRRLTGWNWRRWFVAPPEVRGFWYGLIDEILATRLSKADLVSALEEMLDYSRRSFGPDDLDGWPWRMLVIESEHDRAFSPDARAALRNLYPRASVRTFADAGHAVMVTQPADYIAAVRAFLEEPRAASHDPVSTPVDPPPVAFPFQRPGRLVQAFFKGGTRAYRGPAARLMGASSMLLLTTTGRKTGLPRRTALTFQPLDGRYLVLAGMGTRSDWYRNLLAQPRVEVRIGARRFAARAKPVLDPARRRMLAPGIAAQWDRFGPPRPLRKLLRRWLRFDYDAELAYALAHAEDLPMVELTPSGRSGTNRSAGRILRERKT